MLSKDITIDSKKQLHISLICLQLLISSVLWKPYLIKGLLYRPYPTPCSYLNISYVQDVRHIWWLRQFPGWLLLLCNTVKGDHVTGGSKKKFSTWFVKYPGLTRILRWIMYINNGIWCWPTNKLSILDGDHLLILKIFLKDWLYN